MPPTRSTNKAAAPVLGGYRPRRRTAAASGADDSLGERPLRVVWYRRASTDEANQPYSLDAQEARLRAYTSAQPHWTMVGDYVERASAKDVAGRPELMRLLRDAEEGSFDLVLVARLDRWSRNLVDCLDTVEYLIGHDVAFHSATEHFDTSTPTGMLLLQMLGMFAQFERATIIDRIQRGIQAKLARGIPLSSRVGYGLTVDDQGRLAADTDTIAVVRRILDSYVNGHQGAKAIATALNEDGIPGPGTKRWGGAAVLRILRNRAFVGEVRHRDRWYPGAHEPLVDPDLFEVAQQLLDQRSTKAASASTNSDFVLTGTMTCARCGGAYVGTSGTARDGVIHRYYSCITARRYGAASCDGPSLPAVQLEELVITALLDTYRDHGLFARAVTEHLAQRASRDEPLREQLRTQRGLIAEKERAVARYESDYEKGELPAGLYVTRVEALGEELEKLRAHAAALELELAQEQPTVPDPDELGRLAALLEDRMTDGDSAIRRSVCNTLIASLVVHDRDDIAPTFRLLTPEQRSVLGTKSSVADGEDLDTEFAELETVFAHGASGWSLGDSNP